jgi:acetoin utilization deacetylase AcuC-like enzyme
MTIEGGVLDVPVVWDADCLLHRPGGEVWLGVRDDGTEVPERATVILQSLTRAGVRVVPSAGHDASALLAVHDRALVEHLATIWADWEAGG